MFEHMCRTSIDIRGAVEIRYPKYPSGTPVAHD
jgi:hypothetical protein